jgi:undecaprenyl-diphosphatase
VDWHLYHAVYSVSLHHRWVGSFFNGIETASIPGMVVATVGLWVFARPGGGRKWKLASGSALAAATLALLVNRGVAAIWHRARPYQTHAIAHPWTSSRDASFPSDHASASFAIAFAVLMFDRLVGSLFLVAAALIGVGRVFIGAHYPGDVAAGVVVGFACAIAVVKLARPLIALLVRLVERVTDPLLRPLWRFARPS